MCNCRGPFLHLQSSPSRPCYNPRFNPLSFGKENTAFMDSLRPCVWLFALVTFFLTVPSVQPQNKSGTSILGFTSAHAAKENETEQKFKAIPSPDEERRQHRIFTAEPHLAGS